MKKTMRKMIAALLAITCLPMHAMAIVHADEPQILWYWGTASGNSFKDMEHIETLSGINFAASSSGASHETYLRTFTRYDGNTGYQLYTVTSRDRILRFRLRDGLDANEVMPQILEVVDKYYPGLAANYQPRYGAKVPVDASDYRYADYMFYCAVTPSLEEDTFELRDCRPEEPSAEIGDCIRKELAAKGLISEFYNWGQTAEYQQLQQGHRNLLTYAKYHNEVVGEKKLDTDSGKTKKEYQMVANNIDAIRSYLSEHYSDYNLSEYEEGNPAIEYVEVVPSDELPYPEQVRLMGELYQVSGLTPGFLIPESEKGNGSVAGHNAMERPGDANLDCVVDILDVIAANKNILGVGTLDKTGVKNVDMNGNGTADSEDSLAILKAALDIDD